MADSEMPRWVVWWLWVRKVAEAAAVATVVVILLGLLITLPYATAVAWVWAMEWVGNQPPVPVDAAIVGMYAAVLVSLCMVIIDAWAEKIIEQHGGDD